MANIAIIGAGAMGSALTMPLSTNGNDVRLWGTPLDDDIVRLVKAGKNHPKHNFLLPKSIQIFAKEQLEMAVSGADIIIMAVTSESLGLVFDWIIPFLHPGIIVGSVTKGFDYNKKHEVSLLPEILEERLPESLKGKIPFVFVGGPCKAIEILWGAPTSVCYASTNLSAAKIMQQAAMTDAYRVEVSTDVIGTELCAAMKNAYSVGLGMAEGFPAGEYKYSHKNTKGALFTFAIAEMALLATALGGDIKTVYGLPGAGDLELTGEAGRNRTLGEVIGKGLSASQSIEKMNREDITVEGYPAIRFAYSLANSLDQQGKLHLAELPLLCGLYDILYKDAPAYPSIKSLLQKCTGAY